MLWEDALTALQKKERIFITNRVVGADSSYALPVQTVTGSALTDLFTLTYFARCPKISDAAIFFDKGFTLLVLPYNKIDSTRYKGD